ncbi:MAG: DUF3179 domain-containing (seleno)protein [Pseudomonadota bacterium]|nr:DUF3179 domain-containing (seleno)protein [Pseudomonadota bacterium]
MKKLFYTFCLLCAVPAFASADDVATTEAVIDLELQQQPQKDEGPALVTQVRPSSATIAEETALEMEQAEVIDAVEGELKAKVEERKQEIKIEVGADHDPINYPQFLASIFTLDFENNLIPIEKIVDGGVVVDEIPTLVNPLLISIEEAVKYLDFTDQEYMAVVEINGAARAYPLRILNWHQGVNDDVGGQPVFVAYDPISGNIMAIDRRVAGEKPTTFGVTGQVFKSASLYYDRATKSIWAPFENKAVTGELSGQKMKHYKAVLTTWKSFQETYPDGMVLDIMHTGYDRNYRQNPYGDYAKNKQMLFPVAYPSDILPRKEHVVGVRLFKEGRRIEVAVPVNLLLNQKKENVELAFAQANGLNAFNIPVTFKIAKPFGHIEVTTSDEDAILEVYRGFWFVWSAYNPKTRLINSLD